MSVSMLSDGSVMAQGVSCTELHEERWQARQQKLPQQLLCSWHEQSWRANAWAHAAGRSALHTCSLHLLIAWHDVLHVYISLDAQG